MDYKLISGKKYKSKLLYLIEEKQLFKTKSKHHAKTYFICYQANCPARVELLHDICLKPKKIQNHNHDFNQENFYKEVEILNKVRDECVTAAGLLGATNAISGIRTAFKRAAENNETAAQYLCYDKMKRGMQRITNQIFVKSPKTPLEVIEAFQTESIWNEFGISKNPGQPAFYKACIEDKKISYCIFISEKIINLIKEFILPSKRDYLMDGTFKIVPQGCFKQLLVIYINYFDEKVFPFMFILMNKRTTESYQHLFKYIDDNIFKFEARSFLTDFEFGLKSALKKVHPNATLQGCWFHYCQAIRRNLTTKNKELARLVRANTRASKAFHKFLALALLPSHCIEPAFEMLSNAVRNEFADDFNNFLSYFEKFWINKVGASEFSVFKKTTRTTSDIEAYNGVLGRMVNKNGNFYKFVRVLQEEEFAKSQKFSAIIDSGGAIGAKKRRRVDIERGKQIMEASDLLANGVINIMRFLDRMTYPKNAICSEMEPFEDIFQEYPDEQSEEEEEEDPDNTTASNSKEIDHNLCIICFVARSNIVLLPCKHLQICDECNLKLQAQSIAESKLFYSCPTCRNQVASSMQVFTN